MKNENVWVIQREYFMRDGEEGACILGPWDILGYVIGKANHNGKAGCSEKAGRISETGHIKKAGHIGKAGNTEEAGDVRKTGRIREVNRNVLHHQNNNIFLYCLPPISGNVERLCYFVEYVSVEC